MSEKFDRDYATDLEIDPDELDVAALEQPNLAMSYAKEFAYFDKLNKKADEQVKTLRARLTRECNENPDGCLGKGVKPTGSNVEAYYREHPEYIEAKQAMIDAAYEREMSFQAMMQISNTKKQMIEMLAKLLHMEYYAGPSLPANLSEKWADKKKSKQQETQTRTAKALGRRRKA